jgi:threonine dehydrogenase-like Zn-dependent dehydrogenase
MKALCWHGKEDVRVDNVPEPSIQDPRDIVVKITRTAICGSDLHIYDGFVKFMHEGDILGHEFMGEVVEVGSGNQKFKVGDRVVVPFTIACGHCFFCQKGLYSCCDESNPDEKTAAELMGQSGSGLFGYSHVYGGFPGGQAEYARVPFADSGPIKIPEALTDEQVLFLSDILPTGYMAAENCGIEKGDTVAVWGCGPVGQFSIQSAWMLGAGRVIAIDRVPERLKMAEKYGKAETINFEENKVYDQLMAMTKGRGPDRCIDAVGTEAHPHGSKDSILDNIKTKIFLATDRGHVLREAIYCCRKGGTVSVPGVYFGFIDKFLFGAVIGKALTIKSGQTHVQKYMPLLLEKIQKGEIDPSFVITHRLNLEQAPEAYKIFRDKKDQCIKVVLSP